MQGTDVLATAAEDLGRDIRRPPLKEDGPSEVRQAARATRLPEELIYAVIRQESLFRTDARGRLSFVNVLGKGGHIVAPLTVGSLHQRA